MNLLVRNFNKDTVENLMCFGYCKRRISFASQGKHGLESFTLSTIFAQIYDCGWNQQLGMGLVFTGGRSMRQHKQMKNHRHLSMTKYPRR